MYELLESRFSLKKKVLVVDDEEINRIMLTSIVGKEYEVLTACNGKEAWDVINSNKDTLSLVLLDLLMPELDGYELLSMMQKDLDINKIPVIVLTADTTAEVKSLNMGASDFIPKPYDVPEVILARIKKTIKLSENTSILSATQYDVLTGLFNREFFIEYAGVIDQYYPDVDMDVIAVNFNRFHSINELYGRKFGDELLNITGAVIKAFVSDKRGIGCRYGADLFYVYVPHGNSIDLYKEISAKLQDKIENAGSRIRVGIYPVADRTLEINKRLDCALLACNSVRGNYREPVAFYNSRMHEEEAFAERIMNDLDRALAEKQFVVYYQPKLAIQNGDPYLSSAEALIRWEHPELGMVSPGRFIPVFEENGMIKRLDRYMWKEAARQVSIWKDKYGTTIPVSVNVSRIDMLEDGFTREILDVCEEAGISPEGYMLEVTESAYTDNSAKLIEIVESLRNLGFKIEMDDFGSGYSSLNMLSEMPVDILKLDMKFIRNIHTSSKDLRMVELVIDIARYLELTVVAEGVENKEQFDLLKDAGVDVIQGYYFSKPVPPQEFETFIDKYRRG